MYLNPLIYHKIKYFTAKYFQHAAFDGIFFGCSQQGFGKSFTTGQQFILLILNPKGSSIKGSICYPNSDGHFSNFVADGTKLGNGYFKLFAGFGIGCGRICRATGTAQGSSTQF